MRPAARIPRAFALLCPALAAGFQAFAAPAQPSAPEEDAYENIRVLANAIQLVRQDYVDEKKVGYDKLVTSALRGMLSELDPHSQFLDSTSFKSLQEDAKSEFGGLGIQVGLRGSSLSVLSPMEGSPAFEAGILPGDRILKINGKTTDRMTLADAVEMLRGNVGEKVTLTILRPPSKKLQDFTIQRAVIKVKSVRDAHVLPSPTTDSPTIGYLRISQFSEPTAKELSDALDRLESEGVKALVLDLRYNPGGLLGSAIDVCAQFLPPNTEVVSTSGRSPSSSFLTSRETSKNRKLPLAILINASSASGAEIVAGALKDLGRAVLLGETTFGKGSVQSVTAMENSTAIRLTTATYLTPSRQKIHGVGVPPHLPSVQSHETEKRILRSRQKQPPPPPSADARQPEDPQVERAAEMLRGALLLKKRKPGTP